MQPTCPHFVPLCQHVGEHLELMGLMRGSLPYHMLKKECVCVPLWGVMPPGTRGRRERTLALIKSTNPEVINIINGEGRSTHCLCSKLKKKRKIVYKCTWLQTSTWNDEPQPHVIFQEHLFCQLKSKPNKNMHVRFLDIFIKAVILVPHNFYQLTRRN